eukprot:m.98418 g.98418  ORF g.98418 m.98418 type:complete len:59 (-) comp16745_c0_seq5:745-921(-)
MIVCCLCEFVETSTPIVLIKDTATCAGVSTTSLFRTHELYRYLGHFCLSLMQFACMNL